MSNIDPSLRQSLQTGEPTLAPDIEVEKKDIDLSELLAAERDQLGDGFDIVIGEYGFTTIGQVPASTLAKLSKITDTTDISIFVTTIGDLIVERDLFLDFVDSERVSIEFLTELYKEVLEKITGKAKGKRAR